MGCCNDKMNNKKIISSSPKINNQIFNINIKKVDFPSFKSKKIIDVNNLEDKEKNEICFDIYNNQKSIKEIIEKNKIKLLDKKDHSNDLILKENISTNDLLKVSSNKKFIVIKNVHHVNETINLESDFNQKSKFYNSTNYSSLKLDFIENEILNVHRVVNNNVNRKKYSVIKLELFEILNDTNNSNQHFFFKTINSLGFGLNHLKTKISMKNENSNINEDVNYDNPLVIKNSFKKSTNAIEIDIIISPEANMYNCWFEENETYNINISGKWALDFSLPIIDFEGYQGEEYNGYPLGCILGRISSDNNWFPIINNMVFTTSNSGFLFLRVNCNPLINTYLKPDGNAMLSIKTCIRLSKDDFNNKIQFYKSLAFQSDLSNDVLSFHSDFENSVITYINQIRIDTKKFVNIYLKDYQNNLDKNKSNLYNYLTKEKIKTTENVFLEKNDQYYTVISKNRSGLKPELKLKIIANSILKDVEKNKLMTYERYDKYSNFYSSKFVIHKLFTRNNLDSFNTAIEIVLNKSDINKIIRKEIMSEKYSYIGISIKSFKNSLRIICLVLSNNEDSK